MGIHDIPEDIKELQAWAEVRLDVGSRVRHLR